MENKQDGITIFDALFTNNHICMMKLLLPMLSPSGQKNIAIYIKYLELQYTLKYFARHPQGLSLSPQPDDSMHDFNNIFENLLPYCTPREKERFLQIRNMLNTFRNMQDMMETINTMKELFPEGFDFSENSGFGSLFPDMFADKIPDISQMATLFQSFQTNDTPSF